MVFLAQSHRSRRIIVSCLALCLSVLTSGAVGVRITNLCKEPDYLFVRGEVYGQTTNWECIIDTFVATNLMTEWRWIDANRLEAEEDETALLIVPQILGTEAMPPQMFVRMSDRVSENGDMADCDSDGSPNVYEIHNGTNPYVADFESAPKISVSADCGHTTFTNALWSSSPYSIVEISGEMYFTDSIDLPGWPLLITGPTNGYAVIHSSADIGVFMVNRRQTSHTLIRNVYLTMDKKANFQAGFWIGGNLPWSTDSAGASFENVRLRMYNPGIWYYGWHMYGITDTPVAISNCTVSAMGATDVLPVYVHGDSQVVVTNGLELVNMPNSPPSSEYSWSGYLLTGHYDPSCDCDGDGISDRDEVLAYGTDPFLKDSDGDRISDLEEILHGANPTNQDVYCFGQTISVTNDHSRVASVKLAFYDVETGRRMSEIAELTNHVGEVSLHCVVDGAWRPSLRMWHASEEAYVSIPYAINGHDNATAVQSSLVNQLYDADGDEIPDVWEVNHGLSPQDADDALEDFDGDGLVNLHEYWAGTDPNAIDGTNTLLSICAKSVDRRLAGKDPAKSLHKFSDYTANGTNFVLNADFWSSDVDSSCASMWNDATFSHLGTACYQWNKAGTAISKRHIIVATHYPPPIGATLWFMGNDGRSYSRVVTAIQSLAGDISIQLLDCDLPDAVRPVKILPSNYASYIRNGKRLPVVTFDQEEKLMVADSSALKELSCRSEVSEAIRPYDSTRLSFFETVVSGDSGNPRFLVIGNELVLLYVLHYGGAGSGCFVSHYKNDIQETMDKLCPGYVLEEIDLGRYSKIDE